MADMSTNGALSVCSSVPSTTHSASAAYTGPFLIQGHPTVQCVINHTQCVLSIVAFKPIGHVSDDNGDPLFGCLTPNLALKRATIFQRHETLD